jgi:hypothetical protein
MAAFTSRIASPSAARASCRRFGRSRSHAHTLARKIKHPPLEVLSAATATELRARVWHTHKATKRSSREKPRTRKAVCITSENVFMKANKRHRHPASIAKPRRAAYAAASAATAVAGSHTADAAINYRASCMRDSRRTRIDGFSSSIGLVCPFLRTH